jgi:hypothetical protein
VAALSSASLRYQPLELGKLLIQFETGAGGDTAFAKAKCDGVYEWVVHAGSGARMRHKAFYCLSNRVEDRLEILLRAFDEVAEHNKER